MAPWHHPENIACEIRVFAQLLRQEGARSYLEIGSKFGGSLWSVLSTLSPMRAVSVDLHRHGTAICDCVVELEKLGHSVALVEGDCKSSRTIDLVKFFGPFDVVYIDGNHSERGVVHDWETYGPMGRIVAFHDIVSNEPTWYVPQLWAELKKQYRHKEIVGLRSNYGIGIIWRY